MIDESLVRFTAHQLPREELHPLMARSDGPALRHANHPPTVEMSIDCGQ